MKRITSIDNRPQEKERFEENGLIPVRFRENGAILFYDPDTKTLMTREKIEADMTSFH